MPRSPVSPGLLRILVVGAGLCGAIATRDLRSRLGVQVGIDVWEMARGAGGRASTTRSSAGAKADMGALQLTSKSHSHLVKPLLATGLLTPASRDVMGSPEHQYVATDGLNGVNKYFLRDADTVIFEKRLNDLNLTASGLQWEANGSARKDASIPTSIYDAVLLAVPPSSILRVRGNFMNALGKETMSTLKQVRWTSHFSLGLFYHSADTPRIHDSVLGRHPRRALIHDYSQDTSKVIQRVSLESVKHTAMDPAPAATLVLHSTEAFFAQHRKVPAGGGKGGGRQKGGGQSHGAFVSGAGREEVVASMVLELARLYPGLEGVETAEVKLISWRESRVVPSKGRERLSISSNGSAPLALCGDWLTASDFDGCCRSAEAAVESLCESLMPGGAGAKDEAAACRGELKSIDIETDRRRRPRQRSRAKHRVQH